MLKILITGGSGFIGKNLKEQLGQNYSIYAPSSKDLNLLDEHNTEKYLNENNFDVILHSATWNATRTSIKDTNKVLENNLRMFFNLTRCKVSYQKMIYFGSGAEFSRENWKPKMKESYFDQYIPKDQYGFSKYIMNHYTQKSNNIYNLRLFGVFGKYEDWQIRFISQTCCRILFDMPVIINQNVNFDYLYIDDLVKITEWFIHNNPEENVYNICTGQVYDLETLANKIIKFSGKTVPVSFKEVGFGREYSGNNCKLLKKISKFNFTSIDTAISNLYKWYQENLDTIDKNKLI